MFETTPSSPISAHRQEATRREFLKSCGFALGVLATGAADSVAAAQAVDAAAGASDSRTFHIMPHSHIDVEWYWTFATGREWTKEIFDQALKMLREDPEFRFTQDQVVLLQSYWESLDEEGRSFLRRMVAEGRFAIVGGTYVQPEVAEPSGESLVRQILLGQQWLMKMLGIRARCAWFIDTFGQIPQLPQILRRAGYEAYVFWRDIPPDYPIETLPADFLCESPDGSRILTHWMAGGYSIGQAQIRAVTEHSRTPQVLLPFGSDISRPRQNSMAMREDMEGRLGRAGVHGPRLRISTAMDYLEALRPVIRDLPIIQLDFNPPFRAQDLRGTYDNRIALKLANRAAEQALYSAEFLAAAAQILGRNTIEPVFHLLWENLLFTHFHDIIGGSHADPIYRGAMERLQVVQEKAQRISQDSLKSIVPRPRSTGDWLVVYNTLSVSRTDVCRLPLPLSKPAAVPSMKLVDDKGRPVACRVAAGDETAENRQRTLEFIAKDVPPAGYSAYRLVTGRSAVAAPRYPVGANFFENDQFRLEWDPRDGDLVRLQDRRQGREVFAGPGNIIVAAREKNPDMEGDLRLTGEEYRSSGRPALAIGSIQDAIALRLRVGTRFPDFLLEREIVLYHALRRIDFRTTIRDFTGGDFLFKVAFAPRLDWGRVRPVYQTPFAATPRPKGHFAAYTWVDCSDDETGLTLLNRGTPGYWIGEGKMELVLLRTFARYIGYQQRGRGKHVPGFEQSTQTELARELGTHTFEYALVPHAGDWRSVAAAEMGQSYNTPLLTMSGLDKSVRRESGQSLLSAAPDFLVTALKRAEDGKGWILRGYETRGEAHQVEIQLPRSIRSVWKTSLLEEPEEALSLANHQIRFACRPHEIVTLRMES